MSWPPKPTDWYYIPPFFIIGTPENQAMRNAARKKREQITVPAAKKPRTRLNPDVKKELLK